MPTCHRFLAATVCLVALVTAVPGAAQVESQLSAYTGDNARGYLQPLANAFGATLNNGFYYTAYIPKKGLRFSLEFPVMGVIFSEEDRFFQASTEGGFMPTTTQTAPTVVGSGSAITVPGQAGTAFAFPGGFDLNSFGLAVPQLRFGAIAGTEGLVRILPSISTGDAEIGEITLYGFGVRHSVSQYFDLPVDLAGGFFWQALSVGKNSNDNDLLETTAFSLGAQASKGFPLGFMTFEPYTGLSWDSFKMDVNYTSDTDGSLTVDFDQSTTVRWTLGAGINFVAGHFYGQYDFSSFNSFSFGIALGKLNV